MSQIITAIFDGETLHPETPLNLSPNQRYQVIITPMIEISHQQPIKEMTPDEQAEDWLKFMDNQCKDTLGLSDEAISRDTIYG